MTEELQLSIVENIRRTFDEATSLAMSASERGRDAILKARECGHFLIEAKIAAGDRQWGAWFANHSSQIGGFTIKTAQKWMALAETPIEDLEQALSLRQAYIAAGILPEPDGHASNNKTLPGGCRWLDLLDKTWAEVGKLRSNIGTMPITQIASLKQKLKPLAELYDTL